VWPPATGHRPPAAAATAAGEDRQGVMTMGAIHVHEFMSLDGVIDAPVWTAEYGFPPRLAEVIGGITGRCRGILLGRVTYEMFEPAWSVRTADDDPGAPFFNDTTKYVVSTTLTKPTWRNTTVIGGYDPTTLRQLKDEGPGDLYVSGSSTLVRAMLADSLVDELHLFAYPLTRGTGPRVFPETPINLTLAVSEQLDNGVVYLNYQAKR
jgi:dihydrofolate reductase